MRHSDGEIIICVLTCKEVDPDGRAKIYGTDIFLDALLAGSPRKVSIIEQYIKTFTVSKPHRLMQH